MVASQVLAATPQAAAFVGAQSFLDSRLRVLRAPCLTCEQAVLSDLAPVAERRVRARRAEAAIATATGVPHGAIALAA